MNIALLALLLVPVPPGTSSQPPRCTLAAASQAALPVLFPLELEDRITHAYPVLIVDFDAGGKVDQVSVERSSRNRPLDRDAMEKARRWRYDCVPGDTPSRQRVVVLPPTCTLDQESRRQHPPAHPAQAHRALPAQGRVVLGMRANVRGPAEVILAARSDHPELDEAAMQAARQWRMQCPEPPQADEGWWEVPVEFMPEQ